MGMIKVLDCTLRDGGCVNNFEFGENYIFKILDSLKKSNVDAIECGYIDNQKGSESGRTQYISEEAVEKTINSVGKDQKKYLAMIDYGKYDLTKLPHRSANTIDGIRLAFHKEKISEAIVAAKIILTKGYELFVQPMIAMRYTDAEMLSLIQSVNEDLAGATAFYLVDSFGEMRTEDVKRFCYLIDNNLNSKIAMGFHSHNNLQMSYSNAIEIIGMNLGREIYIDSSILGMGKGAGNLNTELLLEYMNRYKKKEYRITPLLTAIDEVLNQIYAETPWGYSIEYYLSSVNHCTPSYAGYYYNKHTLRIEQISDLLSKIDDAKKISFDKKYAENLFIEYCERKQDDQKVVEKYTKLLNNKVVLIIAPGKSISKYEDEILNTCNNSNVYTISLNSYVGIETDLTIITKSMLNMHEIRHRHILVTSNVELDIPHIDVLDYEKWINKDSIEGDSAIVIAFNFLKACGVKKVILAGCDGFSACISENYYNSAYNRPILYNQADERNQYIAGEIKRIKEFVEVKFLTPSKYEEIINEMDKGLGE